MSDPNIYRRLAALERWRDDLASVEMLLLGSGTAGRIPQWAAGGQSLEDSTLAKTGAGLVTINAASAFTLELAAGSFTPAWSGTTTGGSITYNAQVGRYVRIGNLVFVQAYVNANVVSVTPTGNLIVTNLPFTSANVSNAFGGIAIMQYDGLNLAAGTIDVGARIDPNTAHVQFMQNIDNGNSTAIAGTVLANGTTIILAGTYLAG